MKLVKILKLDQLKLKPIDLEPETKKKLEMYLEYLKDDGVKEDVKIEDVVAGCIDLSLKKFDKDFIRWYRMKLGLKPRGARPKKMRENANPSEFETET